MAESTWFTSKECDNLDDGPGIFCKVKSKDIPSLDYRLHRSPPKDSVPCPYDNQKECKNYTKESKNDNPKT